jgi:hypothetical protein
VVSSTYWSPAILIKPGQTNEIQNKIKKSEEEIISNSSLTIISDIISKKNENGIEPEANIKSDDEIKEKENNDKREVKKVFFSFCL